MSLDIFLLRNLGWKMGLATMQARLHRLTPFPSARRRGTSKIYCAESYCVAPLFSIPMFTNKFVPRYKKQKDVFRHLSAS